MHIDELESALWQLAASQPEVSPTSQEDVVRRARRHRARNAAGVLVIAAALVAGIAFASVDHSPKTSRIGVHPGPVAPAPSTPQQSTSIPPSTTPTATHTIPAGFQPFSVTFVSPRTGWLLGTMPCPSSPCVALLRTDDAGRSWKSIPAPPAKIYDGSTLLTTPSGINEVRFANLNDGWIFGPELWATHDGGAHWSRSALPGVAANAHVMSLEASAGRVHLAVLDDSQSIEFKIESSPANRDDWQLSKTTIPIGAGPVPNTQLVLQGSAGWLIEVDRAVVGGARLENGSWMPWQPPCGRAGGQALIAASTPRDLAVICDEGVWGGPPRAEHAYVSTDAGSSFQPVASPVPIQSSEAIATPAAGTIVIADSGLVSTFDGGRTWRTDPTVAGHNEIPKDLGFTSPDQGVVVLADPLGRAGGTLFMTFDGAHTWNPVTLTSSR
jgi:hypothetical protein